MIPFCFCFVLFFLFLFLILKNTTFLECLVEIKKFDH